MIPSEVAITGWLLGNFSYEFLYPNLGLTNACTVPSLCGIKAPFAVKQREIEEGVVNCVPNSMLHPIK